MVALDIDFGKESEFFFSNGDWDFTAETYMNRSLISLYFIFTTLSTVGFGDYHPRSN